MTRLLKILTLFIAIGAVGGAVMMWMVLEWWVWGFNALSNIFFVLGLVEAIAAILCIKKTD